MLYAQLTGTLGTVQQGHGRALQQCTAQLRGLAGACKRCGQRSVPRPEQGTELLCGSACNSLWNRKKNSEKPIRQYKTIQDKKGQDKTETIEKKRKPADVPAAVVAATIGLAEVSLPREEKGLLPLRPYAGWETLVDEIQADRFWMEIMGMHPT